MRNGFLANIFFHLYWSTRAFRNHIVDTAVGLRFSSQKPFHLAIPIITNILWAMYFAQNTNRTLLLTAEHSEVLGKFSGNNSVCQYKQ